MKLRDGWWWVEHDHESKWKPKEDWLREKVGEENIDWIGQNAIFDTETISRDISTPLQWGIKDPVLAMMFELIWA